MTKEETRVVNDLIVKGYGYKRIASITGLPINSLKSYCRRNKETLTTKSKIPTCKSCGIPVAQNSGRKPKIFCSDSCRMKLWNLHRDEVHHKNVYSFICPICGTEFYSRGKPNRKFCSRECAAIGRRKDRTNHEH